MITSPALAAAASAAGGGGKEHLFHAPQQQQQQHHTGSTLSSSLSSLSLSSSAASSALPYSRPPSPPPSPPPPPTVTPTALAASAAPLSLLRFLLPDLCSLPQHKDPSPGRTAARVRSFLVLPFELERFFFLGQTVCLDAFLEVLVLMPMRGVLALFTLLTVVFGCAGVRGAVAAGGSKSKNNSDGTAFAGVSGPGTHMAEGTYTRALNAWRHTRTPLLRLTIFLTALIVTIVFLSPATLYHYVRAQSLMKLYVIHNMLQIFDSMLTSLGDDILDSTYTAFAPASAAPVAELVSSAVLAAGYTVAHAALTMLQIVTLNVTVNSDMSTLFIILISTNFTELKSFVFKRFFHANLFQISVGDAVERFRLIASLSTIAVQNLAHIGLTSALSSSATTWAARVAVFSGMLYGSEMLVDWIKHGFVNKFNHLPSMYRAVSSNKTLYISRIYENIYVILWYTVYFRLDTCIFCCFIFILTFSSLLFRFPAALQFRTVACRDVILHRAHPAHPHHYTVSRRFGFAPEPLAIVVLRASIAAYGVLPQSQISWPLLVLLPVTGTLARYPHNTDQMHDMPFIHICHTR